MSVYLDTMRGFPDILRAGGVVGSIIYIGGFALVQSGRTCGNGPLYSASKVIAAVLVLISLVGEFNLGAFIIQVGFITFGLMGLVRQFSDKHVGTAKGDQAAVSDVVAESPPQIGYSRPSRNLGFMRPDAISLAQTAQNR